MTSQTMQGITELIRLAMRRSRYEGEQEVLSGRMLPGGIVSLAGAPAGKTWVRSSIHSREFRAVIGTCTDINVPLIIGLDKAGYYYIMRINQTGLTDPDLIAYYWSTIMPVPDLNIGLEQFRPGRMLPTAGGGMRVIIEAFTYERTRVPTTEISVPAPANSGWLRSYYNPILQQFGWIQGVPASIPDETTLPNVPNGMIALDAVYLTNGQSSITSADTFFAVRHVYHPQQPLDNWAAVAPPTVNADTTQGYSVGSRWYDTLTGVTFTCYDPTATSAVWRAQEGQAIVTKFGTVTTDLLPVRLFNLMTGSRYITAVFAALGTAPTGDDLQIDVLVGGVSIFTSPPLIVPDGDTDTYITSSGILNPEWPFDVELSVDIVTTGVTIAPRDLTLHIIYYG